MTRIDIAAPAAKAGIYLIFIVRRTGDVRGPTVADYQIDYGLPMPDTGRVYFGGGEIEKTIWARAGMLLDRATVTLTTATGAEIGTASATYGVAAPVTPPPIPAPVVVAPPAPAPVVVEPKGTRGLYFDFTKAPPPLYHPVHAPTGFFKTNYWYSHDGEKHYMEPVPYQGRWEDWGDDATSRSGYNDQQTFSAAFYNGINPFVSDSAGLHIRAAVNANPTDLTPKPYTGGFISTERTWLQKYGRYGATVQLPAKGCGAWSAMCLYGVGLDAGREIDIFEHMSNTPDILWLTAHPGGPSKMLHGDWTSKPFLIELHWRSDFLVWYIDGVEVHRLPNEEFHTLMHVNLNVAVGGWDGNEKPNPADFPMEMIVRDLRIEP